MRKKKYIAKIGALCLMLAMLFPTAVFAAEQSTKLTTKVPDTHTVRLEIGDHGSVTVGKETYTGTKEIQVKRLAEVSYKIKADGKYEIETVTYDGADVTDQLHGKSYQAAPINKDGIVFKVTFRDKKQTPSSPAETPGMGTSGTGSADVQTGDITLTGIWEKMLALSIIAVFVCAAFRKKIAQIPKQRI